MITKIELGGDITDRMKSGIGGRIEIAPGSYYLSEPIDILAPTEIVGGGEWFTAIEAPAGAFRAQAPTKIRDLSLFRADRPITEPAYGVLAEACVHLSDVSLAGFTVGVYIWASVSERQTNANAWRLRHLTIKGSGHSGVLVRGRDVNAGHAEGLRIYTAGEHASQWTALLGRAAGIVDRSFLGCTWVAPLISSSHERVGGLRIPLPAMILDGASQHSVVVGMYAETDQAQSIFDQASIVLGGIAGAWAGNDNPRRVGLRIDGPTLNALVVRNAKDPANVVDVRMGEVAASGTMIEFRSAAIDISRPLRIKAEARSKCYRWDVANQTVVLRIGQDGTLAFTPTEP